jgi:rubrerythrin
LTENRAETARTFLAKELEKLSERNLIEDILNKEEEHADDLSNMLETFDPEKALALIGESYRM